MLPFIDILQWINVHECRQESQLSIRTYSTCIPFLPSKVTTELVNTIVEHEIDVTIHYY
jgi:hypothetical protein